MKNIIWVASYPKSGNTWVRSVLYAAIHGEVELSQLGSFIPNFSVYAANLVKKKLTNPGDIRFKWSVAQSQLSKEAGDKRIFLKTHNIAGTFDCGHFPDKALTNSFIYIYRDPRDIAISYSHHFDHPIDVSIKQVMNTKNMNFMPEDLSRGEFISSWDNHIKSWSQMPFRKLFVKYENMIANPETEIMRILNFCSVEPQGNYQQLMQQTNFTTLQKQENKTGFPEAIGRTAFFRKGVIGQWKESKTDFSPLETTFKDVMTQLGYL